ncbi:formate C-acetyltransferase (plasmid) [Telmatobacter bradus]|uniref:formate C-acetyltransferase n=1 Tax=Telmatobacter bradus TaxID=474953 RepID=UPI003B439D13
MDQKTLPLEENTTSAAWQGFAAGLWMERIDTRNFIQCNYTPYEGDASFLAGPTEKTRKVWAKIADLLVEERAKGGVLAISHDIPSTITAHAAGYIDRENESIVGLQTEAPLKRAIMPFGGLRMVEQSLQEQGVAADPLVHKIFTEYRKTHNNAVFEMYTPEIRRARSSHIVTGLPDAYGRGRIIGDYRRVALYGVDRLIEDKKREKAELDPKPFSEDVVRLREELSEQMGALNELKQLGSIYGFDLSRPAITAQEAVQWTYLGYLAAVKEQNGAAMSLGRVSTFLDIYIERDLKAGRITEAEAQELVDQMVIKLRIVRFLRTQEYDAIFSGDPTWVTESIGGMGADGRTLVTKSSYRFLQTLYNMGPAPEPNLTILWSSKLPQNFKKFCTQTSLDTSSLQYENDDLLRKQYGDDTAIACCVSGMAVGKQMQFFGARVNLAKTLLYAINGGRDELSGKQIAPVMPSITDEVLRYEDVLPAFETTMEWLAKVYVEALNIIHYSHDKYSYEKLEMALHDRDIVRTLGCGIAGLSVVADSLSAIKYAKVRPVRDENGVAVDFVTEGEFPTYGNNDDRVDEIAVWVVNTFMDKVRQQPVYRNAVHTQSILTITSNVVYGKYTGNTPDGRRKGQAFAPGANPMHGRDKHGLIASALSIAKLPYEQALDGISLTSSMTPDALGRNTADRVENLASSLDVYFDTNGYHMNVNVLNRETLLDAMDHPEKYPQLTVRVSGYAVNFIKLTREQQLEVIDRTFHQSL